MKRAFFYISFILCFTNTTCEDDDLINPSICDEVTIVDENLYGNLESDDFNFVGAEIIDDCIHIKIASSGCDGNSWQFKLVDSGAVAESLPEQRYLKFQLENEELCDAYFEKTISFDLIPIQVSGSNEIILHIDGLEGSLNYSY